ncbi:hypothetical protein EDD18DRAFT_683932 [Armillaria luteobubalina]|uniref:Uncharacterized protein n=1 Tax=Armillaria luteobubalina TaxID=153913 RepID=A0AA39QFY4_9AGAR|nr:hypothetical protein EDD18DRAFT_683932 [Armillaria luteobubalina]
MPLNTFIILLFLFIPLVLAEPSSVDSDNHDLPDNVRRRTLWNVLWSCLTAIFASTWLAVHPNVPGHRITGRQSWSESLILSVYERLTVTGVAIIAPEIIVAWAAAQFTVAWEVCYGEKFSIPSIWKSWERDPQDRLTMTHGYFLSMGGFEGNHPHTSDERRASGQHPSERGDKLLFSLDALVKYPCLRKRLREIKKEDITDRSKGDYLSKFISILQISWFMVQCFARINQNLPITLLELTALSFAGMSIIARCLWLHKPLNVKYHIYVGECNSSQSSSAPPPEPGSDHEECKLSSYQSTPAPAHEGPSSLPSEPTSQESKYFSFLKGYADTIKGKVFQTVNGISSDPMKWRATAASLFMLLLRIPIYVLLGSMIMAVSVLVGSVIVVVSVLVGSPFIAVIAVVLVFGFVGLLSCAVVIIILIIILTLTVGVVAIVRLTRYLPVWIKGQSLTESEDSVQGLDRFSCGGSKRTGTRDAVLFVIGSIFGAIHCIAWSFDFPSHAEMLLWRISSLSALLLPMLVSLVSSVFTRCAKRKDGITVPVFAMLYAYITARSILIVLAFMQLRSLPPLALSNVQWTDYIPHF